MFILVSENKCETPKIVAIDAFTDELIEDKETSVAVDWKMTSNLTVC